MAVPVALMAAGTGIKIVGNLSSNMAAASQERDNAKFYMEQARLARLVGERQASLASFNYTHKIGEQIGAYAASNVDLSGSAAVTVGGAVANLTEELWNIKQEMDLNVKLARSRASAASSRADQLGSISYNLLQAGTTVLSDYAASEGFGMGFPSWMQPGAPTPSNTAGTYKFFPAASSGSSEVLAPQYRLNLQMYEGK